MILSVVYSSDERDRFAPYQILLNDQPFLDGIEFEAEAISICKMLDELPEVPPPAIRPKHLLTVVHPKPHPLDPPAWHDRWHRQRGSILIEAAIMIPLFLMLCFAGLDCLWAMQEKSTVVWLAQQAAACSVATPPGACNPQTFVTNQAAGLGLTPARLTLTAASGSATVTYQTVPLSLFFPALTLTASATAAP